MLLEKLTAYGAVSGHEKPMREQIKAELESLKIPFTVDKLGNVIAHKEKKSKKKVLLYTHMDEPGMMISDIDSAGLLKFLLVGGLNVEALMSKQVVVGDEGLQGVIGAKAIHLQEPGERKRILDRKSLYIDIGAKDEEDAKAQVKKGDYAALQGPLRPLEEGFLTAKFLESKVGIALILSLLKEECNLDITALFTTMHHVGNRGEQIFMENRDFDFAIGVCGACANDNAYSDDNGAKIALNKGAGLKLLDGRSIYQKDFYQKATALLIKNKIPHQTLVEPRESGGFYHLARRSQRLLGTEVFMPVRYANTPVSMIHKKDCDSAKHIIQTIFEGIEGGQF